MLDTRTAHNQRSMDLLYNLASQDASLSNDTRQMIQEIAAGSNSHDVTSIPVNAAAATTTTTTTTTDQKNDSSSFPTIASHLGKPLILPTEHIQDHARRIFGITSQDEKKKQPVQLQITENTKNLQHRKILKEFLDVLYQFVRKMSKGFPKCPALAQYVKLLKEEVAQVEMAQQLLIKKWYDLMSPHMDAIESGRIEELLALPDDKLPGVFVKVNARVKWRALCSNDGKDGGPSSKTKVVNTLVQLNRLSSLYVNMPQKMRDKVENVANKFVEKIAKGEIKSFDIHEMGSNAIKEIDKEDLKSFIDNAGKIYRTIGGKKSVSEILGDKNIADEVGQVLENIENNTLFKQTVMNDFVNLTEQQKPVNQEQVIADTIQTLKSGWKSNRPF